MTHIHGECYSRQRCRVRFSRREGGRIRLRASRPGGCSVEFEFDEVDLDRLEDETMGLAQADQMKEHLKSQ
jgi:hypothetical protein